MRHKLLRVFLISFTFFAVSSVGLLPAKKLSDGAELFRAIREGNIDVVKSHLTKSDLAVRDGRGATPLMHAAAFGNLETLKLLLDVGADVNAHSDSDATALLWAARDPEKARLLIERGADVNAVSKQGQTPLISAASRPDGSAIVALLIAKGANIDFQDGRRNSTALNVAAEAGDIAILGNEGFALPHPGEMAEGSADIVPLPRSLSRRRVVLQHRGPLRQ